MYFTNFVLGSWIILRQYFEYMTQEEFVLTVAGARPTKT